MTIQPGVGYTFTSSGQGTNLNIQTPWSEWAQPVATVPEETCEPFKVKNITTEVIPPPEEDPPSEDPPPPSTIVTYDICPGTFNNLMPQVYNQTLEKFEYLDGLTTGYKLVLDFASTTSSLVYLRIGKDATTGAFPPGAPITPYDPADPYPTVFNTGGALPADSDEYGYIALAKVNALTGGAYSVDQYVTGSLWGNRIKLGDNTARYFYARI